MPSTSFWHYSDTIGNAIRCNTGQIVEKNPAYLCGICNPEQNPYNA